MMIIEPTEIWSVDIQMMPENINMRNDQSNT